MYNLMPAIYNFLIPLFVFKSNIFDHQFLLKDFVIDWVNKTTIYKRKLERTILKRGF